MDYSQVSIGLENFREVIWLNFFRFFFFYLLSWCGDFCVLRAMVIVIVRWLMCSSSCDDCHGWRIVINSGCDDCHNLMIDMFLCLWWLSRFKDCYYSNSGDYHKLNWWLIYASFCDDCHNLMIAVIQAVVIVIFWWLKCSSGCDDCHGARIAVLFWLWWLSKCDDWLLCSVGYANCHGVRIILLFTLWGVRCEYCLITQNGVPLVFQRNSPRCTGLSLLLYFLKQFSFKFYCV